MALTAGSIRTLTRPGKYLDGHGLALHVVTPQRRYWCFRYQRAGRERTMGFGSADIVTLAQARKLHTEARALLARGIDPLDARTKKKQPSHTFASVVDDYIAADGMSWRGTDSITRWRHSLIAYAVPVFGTKNVTDVTLDDVLAALQPIWVAKSVLAQRVRSRIEMVLDFAKARGWRSGENPARWRGNLKMLLPAHSKIHVVEHRAALPWRECPALMSRLLQPDVGVAERALAFCVLTATRSSETLGMRWNEVDFDQKTWTIPAARTKSGRPHRVPLSEPTLEILQTLSPMRVEQLVFFSRRGGCAIARPTLLRLLDRLGYPNCTVHGFRSTFRDWAAENRKASDLAELSLAHTIGGPVFQAYARSDLLEPRRVLMEQWAAFLLRPTAEVVPLRAAG